MRMPGSTETTQRPPEVASPGWVAAQPARIAATVIGARRRARAEAARIGSRVRLWLVIPETMLCDAPRCNGCSRGGLVRED